MLKVDGKVVEKGKLDKIFTTRLRGKKIIQDVLCIGISCSLMMAMVPSSIARAVVDGPEGGILLCPSKPNNWGRSDLRVYLNNGLAWYNEKDDTISNKSCLVNSMEAKSNNLSGYAKHFNDEEYALVRPWTYETHEMFDGRVETGTYDLTDKFLLPSGNCSYNCRYVLSWDSQELDLDWNGDDLRKTETHPGRIIPGAYWATGHNWLRTPARNNEFAHISQRGYLISEHCAKDFNRSPSVAAIFKIDLNNVIFASSASAAILKDEEHGKEIDIPGSLNFGKRTLGDLPDYGMYLKEQSENSGFEISNTIKFEAGKLHVKYSKGTAGNYIVVQAFQEDDLVKGSKSYAAAKLLKSSNGEETIDISGWKLTSLAGYTINVWMEDGKSASLAKATKPTSFKASGQNILPQDPADKNLRVFAKIDELQCSWGDLSKDSNKDALDKLIKGDVTSVGENPTNQKIYFGTGPDGKPLQFWIAGRESYPDQGEKEGEINPNGKVMCLYQAKGVEQRIFNKE